MFIIINKLSAFLRIALALLLGAAAPAMAQIVLGSSSSFAVLGGSTVTNTGPTSINGNLGVAPGTAVTGFPPGIVSGGTIHLNNGVAAQAQSDLTTAYNQVGGTACTLDLTGQDLGGLTLTPGVYCFSSSAQLTGILTLNAQGNPNALFIFKTGSSLTTASNASVVVIGGGSNCNVFWQVGSSATLGTGTSFAGNILALSSITLTTGASVSGRVLARNGAVTLDSNTVAVCAVTCPSITVNPLTLPNGVLGSPYSQTVSASGGSTPYTFAISSGSLPSGLILNPATGMISGTPNAAGTFTFTVTATDINNCPGSRQYTIVIPAVCPLLTVNPLTLPNGALGQPYNQTISATGGTAPYILALTSGQLPNGLIFSPATGIISGVPTLAGTFTFTVTATDINNCPGSRQYTIVIPAVCPLITVNPLTLPNGVLGQPYNQTISATGGIAPYILALTSGQLPNGLIFSPATGIISGAPTLAGTFTFTVTATDINNCPGSRQYTIVIPAVCPLITVNPASLPNPVLGVPYSQTILASGGAAPYSFAITAGALASGLSLNDSSGVISGTPSTSGAFNFTISATDANNCPGSRAYSLQLAAPIVLAVPTLSQFGLMVMVLLLLSTAWFRMARE